MASARATPLLRRLEEWLPELTQATVVRLVGTEALVAASSPTSLPVAAVDAIKGRLVRARVGPAASARVCTAAVSASGELACECACGEGSGGGETACSHVVALLETLASAPRLREALLQPAPPSAPPAGADEGELRRRAGAALRRRGLDPVEAREALSAGRVGPLDATFAAWRRRGRLRPLGACRYGIAVERAAPDGPGLGASLRVRIQPLAERRPFGPDDLEARRLTAREWRLLEPLARSPGGQRDFVAEGSAAGLFLDRAYEAGLELEELESGRPLGWAADELRPALRVRPASRSDARFHPALAERRAELARIDESVRAAWKDFAEEVAPVEEGAFRSLLGLSNESNEPAPRLADAEPAIALEAIWVAGSWRSDAEAPTGHPFAEAVYFEGPTAWVLLEAVGRFARVSRDVGPIALARLLAQPVVLATAPEVARLPPLLREHFQAEGVALPSRRSLGLPPLPRPRVVLRVTGDVFAAEAFLEAHYGEAAILLSEESCADLDDPSRDGEAERKALDRLRATSLVPPARGARRRRSSERKEPAFHAEGDASVAFWTRDLPAIVAEAEAGSPIAEVVAPRELLTARARGPLEAHLAVSAEQASTLDVALHLHAEGVAADVEEVRRALAAKRRWVRLSDGSVAQISERIARLVDGTAGLLDERGRASLPAAALGLVRAWSEWADRCEADERFAGWAKRLREIGVAAEPHDLPGLAVPLRGYQRAGVAWLQFLAELGVGGVLADDMGLGKTAQTLALLAWRRQRDGSVPSLVVAPTSVASNWIREASRFTPDLRALLLHGPARHDRYEAVPSSDLVVTSYALLRRDVERLRGIRFRYVILDEAQHIKNHAAATTAAAKSLEAEARLALTGTPIENRLLELWSILDFCNPGMLGPWRRFSRRFERPLAAEGTEPGSPPLAASPEITELRERIRPFVLRRTKSEVLRDLPPKVESDVVVELTPAQRRAYAALATAAREDVRRRLANDGLEGSRMLVLTALLRLRQMACDPRLVDPRHRAEDSAKLLALRELVGEVVASGRRALVFSQFVELLALVRTDLATRGVRYAYLDGRTRDRDAVVESFRQGDMPLFLLSLRAGGSGLNLAAADVVIHLDPWWNPAVEDQATDRAHRIGQTRSVSVYRLIAAGTIEEALLRLKERKRALASVVAADEAMLAKRLTADDIEDLLAFPG